jgi:hypothetical protein
MTMMPLASHAFGLAELISLPALASISFQASE